MSTRELKLVLLDNLNSKLERFNQVLYQPELFINDYFASLRQNIDLNAEEQLQDLNPANDSEKIKIDVINERRNDMITELAKHEKQRQDGSEKWVDRSVAFKKNQEWRDQMDQMFSNRSKSLDDLEDFHDELERQMDKETGTLENVVMQKKSFMFVKKINEKFKTGYLICVIGYYLQHVTLFERLSKYSEYDRVSYV